MKSIFIIFIGFFLLAYSSQAQLLSEAHQKKLEQIKDPAKKQRLYKKYLRKDARKFHKQLADTLGHTAKNALKDSIDNHVDFPEVQLDSTCWIKVNRK